MYEGTFDKVFDVAWRSLDPDNVNKGNDWVKQLYFRAHIEPLFTTVISTPCSALARNTVCVLNRIGLWQRRKRNKQ